jgi:uncharacterized protein YaiL (DUF2058 family)
MSSSLRDQLIKSGLATAAQAKKAERAVQADQRGRRGDGKPAKEAKAAKAADPAKSTNSQKSSGTATPARQPSEAELRAREAQAAKAERDRALQRERNEKAAARALRGELRQLIRQHDQRTPPHDDDVPYNFLHGKRIKRIYVTREHQAALSRGTLVIVNDEGRYHLVADAIAERIRARDPKRIIAAHGAAHGTTPAAAPGEAAAAPNPDDEYYAKFQVPDDLDW